MKSAEIYKKIKSDCEWDYLFRRLAEECSELSQAALKLVRSINRETPVSPADARAAYIEEMADVLVMIDLALEETNLCEDITIIDTMEAKKARMMERLENI